MAHKSKQKHKLPKYLALYAKKRERQRRLSNTERGCVVLFSQETRKTTISALAASRHEYVLVGMAARVAGIIEVADLDDNVDVVRSNPSLPNDLRENPQTTGK